MTPNEHAVEAERLLAEMDDTDRAATATESQGGQVTGLQGALLCLAISALTHAVLALRPTYAELSVELAETVAAPAVPEMWLDQDGDVWTETDGVMVMLDREAAEWDPPALYVRAGVEKAHGPLRPIPGVPS